jgi:integrase
MDSKSAGRKTNLKQYRSVNGKWQFVPVVKVEGNPKPQLVLIDGKPVSWKGGGKFFLEWYEDGKRKTKIAGVSPREALDAWHLQTGILAGNIEAPEDSSEDDTVVTIDAAIAKYLKEVQATKSKATLRAYGCDLRWFRKHCRKHYVSKLNREDMMTLFGAGRDEGLNQKTTNKKVIVALQSMRRAGAVIDLKKGDWPKTTEKGIDIYEDEEIERFLKACDPNEWLLFQVFLQTGFRSREVATLYWDDVDWSGGTLSVRAKPELEFKPKSYEERAVPVPTKLLKALKERSRSNMESNLIFPTPPHPKRPGYGGDKPDAHNLESCKEIAFRAKLNCGRCKDGKKNCAKGPNCHNWNLHKWRHTFATHSIQPYDIRTVQVLLGHKNIATTEKYLKSLRLGDLRVKVEQSSLAAFL